MEQCQRVIVYVAIRLLQFVPIRHERRESGFLNSIDEFI